METKAYVLGLDPGTTTGITVLLLRRDSVGKVLAEQLPWERGALRLAQALRELAIIRDRQLDTRALAVGEEYTLNAKSAQRGQRGAEDAMGMLGVLRHEALQHGVELAPNQKAANVKKLVGDQALRTLGLWSPGMKHANDATRHAVALALKEGLLRPRQMLGAGR